MLGGALDGGAVVGDPFFVCAPRWISNKLLNHGERQYCANGLCYKMQSDKLNEEGVQYSPLIKPGFQGYIFNNESLYYYAQGLTGMSVQLTKNRELLIGAPGVMMWAGTPIHYKNLNDFTVSVPNPIFTPSIKGYFSYLGYAISSGNFLSNKNTLWYVAAAPRGAELNGLVLLFEYPEDDDAALIIHGEFEGYKTGSYFGAALLVADITSDKADDLIIGAPTYVTSAWDEGCIYFYKNNGKGEFATPQQIFGDNHAGARFGTAISIMGDINDDSYQDVAVAAPYENNGKGAVYIFLGSKDGLMDKPSQKISASEINSALKGFGFSLSKGNDIDSNGYNDLAVGAYVSGHVVVVKSRPVIDYTVELKSGLQEMSSNTTKFKFTYCISYDSRSTGVKSVTTNLEIEIDSRASIPTQKVFMEVTRSVECNIIDVKLPEPIIFDYSYSNPFVITVAYQVKDQITSGFCGNCGVADPFKPKSVKLEIPFAHGCGEDKVCQPDLVITAAFENDLQFLVIGSSTSINFSVDIKNKGEPAYISNLELHLPDQVDLKKNPKFCDRMRRNIWNCFVNNVLEVNAEKTLVFELDVENLLSDQEVLNLNLSVNSRGKDVNENDNKFSLNLPLHVETNYQIDAISTPEQIVYSDGSDEEMEDVSFSHEFIVSNLGPSDELERTSIYFEIPFALAASDKDIISLDEVQATINKHGMQCANKTKDKTDSDTSKLQSRSKQESEKLPSKNMLSINCRNDDVKCMTLLCYGGILNKEGSGALVKFQIKILFDALGSLLENKNGIVFETTASIKNANGQEVVKSIQTVLLDSSKHKTSYWVYIAAVLGGIIILATVIFVLYKMNFFRRSIREKLVNETEEGEESIMETTNDL